MKMNREEKQLTEKYFFDTDCLSAFLWVREESILARLYTGRIVLPAQVYNELQRVPHLLARVDTLKNNGDLSVESMEVGSTEYKDYLQMTTSPEAGMRIIGRGEAAGIAMAKQRNGTLASNNLRDIRPYVEKYDISHITTGDILIEAMDAGIITEVEGNSIWTDMIRKRRLLPTTTFSEYLVNCHNPKGAEE
jgi:predicted nucleic acid-binding protein